MNDLSTWNSILAGGATTLIAVAAVLLVLAVLVPRARRVAGLPAAVFALVGAIWARFTQAHTIFGDDIFRSATVHWSLLLGLVASLWWFAVAEHRTSSAGRREHGVSDGAGAAQRSDAAAVESDGHMIVATGSAATRVEASARGLHGGTQVLAPVQVYQARRATPAERRGTTIRAVFGAFAVLVAVGSFLSSTGILPLPFGLHQPTF